MPRRSKGSRKRSRTRGKAASTKKCVNFSDIPERTTKQLRAMRRVGRPPLGDSTRKLIAFRIDPKLLQKLQVKAKAAGIGYQTLMHRILAKGT